MKKILVISLFNLISLASLAQKEAYLFCYFKGNGLDGLHLASSTDGLHFTALKNDSSFLKPTVSKDKLMRDPNILKGKDGYITISFGQFLGKIKALVMLVPKT